MRKKRGTRRDFLRRSATAVGAAVAAPWVIPASALGGDERPAPSERIVMGCIGGGARGQINIRLFIEAPEVQFVAVCDVDAGVCEQAKALIDNHYGNTDCKVYNDFRELLDRGDIDAVDISTPDHWHAIPTIEACKMGIDVHVEKPLSLTIREGRAMVETARRYARVVQTGSEARSIACNRFACELVRNGRIGEVKEVYVSGVGGPSTMDVLPAEPVPDGLDWDMWLGPAPWRPHNSGYHPFTWRNFYDFSGGGLTDWGAHHFDLSQWALGMDDSGPVEIIPPDGKEHKFLTYIYANGVRMYHVLGAAPPVEMLGAVTMIGTEGRIGFRYGQLEGTDPPELARDVIRPGEIHLYQCPPGGHERGDFLTCLRTRQRPGADVEIGHRSVTVAHLGGIAYRLRRPLKWDPVKEEFIGDAEANRMCARPMRAPWRV
ncbi:MAG: Gfo/Idh/MocA family oxidoreductase [Planctomycetota bacterium]